MKWATVHQEQESNAPEICIPYLNMRLMKEGLQICHGQRICELMLALDQLCKCDKIAEGT